MNLLLRLRQGRTRPWRSSLPVVRWRTSRRLQKKPHPCGSPEHENVASYIIQELTAMGLSPEIQETSVVSERHGFPFVGASVKNILVRLPGTSGSRAMLFTLT